MPENEVNNPIIDQETESLRRKNLRREQVLERVLERLWELATMSPEMTRSSITGQVKALSMIVAIEGLIPTRRAGSNQTKPPTPPRKAKIYQSAWLREQREREKNSHTSAGLAGEPQEDQEKDGHGLPQAGPGSFVPDGWQR